MIRQLEVTLMLAVILGGCYIEGSIECPQTDEEYGLWLNSVIPACLRGLVSTLRLSMDDCEQETENMEQCVVDETLACQSMDANSDNDDGTYPGSDYGQVGTYLDRVDTSDVTQNMSEDYYEVFCAQSQPQEAAPGVDIPGCYNQQLIDSTQACSSDFLQAFNADRLGDTLCELFNTMTICQTEKVRLYCPDVEETLIEQDAAVRENSNPFCTNGEYGIGVDDPSFGGGNGNGTTGNGAGGGGSRGMTYLFSYGLSLLFAWMICDVLG